MKSLGSLHISRSSDGIWYFQRWLPAHLRKRFPAEKAVFKKSLRTRNKQKAVTLSRVLDLKFDKLLQKHFVNPKDFSEAMEYLHRYSTITKHSCDDTPERIDDLYSDIGEYGEWMLNRAQEFGSTIDDHIKGLQKEVEDLKEVLKSSFQFEGSSLSKEDLQNLISSMKPSEPEDLSPFLSDLLKQWEKEHDDQIKIKEVMKKLQLFVRVVEYSYGGKVRVASMQVPHIHAYIDLCKSIPSRTKVENFTVHELIELEGKRNSKKTLTDTFGRVGGFLRWIVQRGEALDERLITVVTKGNGVSKLPDDSKKRLPFSDEQLKTLFNSNRFTKSGEFHTAADYWVPLIALFIGARQQEILQLEKIDIVQEKDVWVILFRGHTHDSVDSSKRMKTKGSVRVVPISQILINLGFLEYCNAQTSKVFPADYRTGNRFTAYRNRYDRYQKEECNVIKNNNKEMLDFHSYRHTIETKLTEHKSTTHHGITVEQGLIDAIVGHASEKRSIGEKVYNHSQQIKAKKVVIDLLDYPLINFEKIIKWDQCQFKHTTQKTKK